MLNYLWAFMILLGIIYGAFTGRLDLIGEGILSSAKEAVSLCITMSGVLSLWLGMMNIANKAGITDALTRLLKPFIDFLFPSLKEEKKARDYISTNIIANILGLGWAATPAGLKAMEELKNIHHRKVGDKNGLACVASNEMCTFLIINISSLQLIPINIVAYRSQYGSVNPSAIIAPGLLATLVSTAIAIIFCKIMNKTHPLKL